VAARVEMRIGVQIALDALDPARRQRPRQLAEVAVPAMERLSDRTGQSAHLVVVNKGDRPGAQRTASQLRAMLAAGHEPSTPGDAAASARQRRPKRPEVLITTASTGAGVPELLAALDRHRSTAAADEAAPARLARAEAQVWAIVSDRLNDRLRAPSEAAGTGALIAEVAAHRIDPYAAADRLLERLGG
jgi:LAO/AO transport system kinase